MRYGAKWPRHDMMPMIPCMARVADGVGFGITMSTTYHHPFHIARTFNALDHVTRGRIAWNAVTSAYKNEAANYGFDVMMDHDERYERAQEFLKVACALWDSVEVDALILDREKGVLVHGLVCNSRASPSATSEKPRASTEMAMPGKTLIHQAVPR